MKTNNAVNWAVAPFATATTKDVFALLAEKLVVITSSIFAMICEYNEETAVMTCAGFEAAGFGAARFETAGNQGLLGSPLPSNRDTCDSWRTGRVHLMPQGIRDAIVETLIQKSALPKGMLLQLGDIYSVGLNQHERLLGAAIFGLRKKEALDAEAIAQCTPLAAIVMQHEIDQRMLVRFEERIQFAFQNSLDVFGMLDPNLQVLKVSPSVKNLIGLSPEELIGKRLDELSVMAPEDMEQALADARRVLAKGQPERQIYTLQAHDGSARITEVSLAPHGQNGGPGGLVVMLRDITQNIKTLEAHEQSEEFYRSLIQASPDPIVVYDSQGNLLAASAKAAQVYGADSTADLLSTVANIGEILDEESRRRAFENFPKAITDGVSRNLEYRIRRRDGSTFLGEANSSVIHRPDGSLLGFISIIRDTTERRKMEAAIREKEERLAAIFRAAPIGIGMVINRVIQEVNESLCRMTGYSPEELLGHSARILYHSDEDFEYVGRVKYAEMEKNGTASVDTHWRHKSGAVLDIILSSTPLDRNDYPKGVTFTALDITDRRQALDALRETTEELDAFFNHAQDLLCIADTDGHFRRLNPEWEKTLGYPLEALIDHRFMDLVHPDDVTATIEAVMQLSEQREVLNFINRYRHKDGTYRWIEWRSVPSGQIIYAAARDITNRKRNETLLAAQKSLAEKLATVEDMPQALSICLEYAVAYSEADSGAIYVVNEKNGLEMAVQSGLWGTSAEAAFSSEITALPFEAAPSAATGAVANGNGIESLTVMPVTREGEMVACLCVAFHTRTELTENVKHWLESLASQIGSVMERLQAVARKKQVEGQLQEIMKLEAVGRLSGGVAHHFNNLLTVIMGQTEMLLRTFTFGDPAHADLQQIWDAAQRASALTAHLLTFSRKQVIEPKIVNLCDMLAGTVGVLKKIIGNDIHLRIIPRPGTGLVKIDPTQLDLALVHLVANARDAMPGGGELTMDLNEQVIDQSYCQTHPDASPGRYIVLSIADTGCGMTPETLAHIFEPFFTTKDIGEGVGLGLSMIYGAIRQNKGFIEVESEVGAGTTVRIFLPQLEEVETASSAPPLAEPPSGNGTILLVEDEEMVRNLARRILERQGYRVLAAAQAEEVAALIEHNGPNIDLLLTDMMLPGMNGKQLYGDLHRDFPNLRVIYMSGYLADVVGRDGELAADLPFLQKPFSIHALTSLVQKVLTR